MRWWYDLSPLYIYLPNGPQYTYYTLTIFSIPVPQALKRSLTTIQIIQFVVGVLGATIHLFLSYTVPVKGLDESFVKGMPKNIKHDLGEQIALPLTSGQATEYRIEIVSCLDTSGQVFSILLNVIYLIPLAVLFIRFFIRSYIRKMPRKDEGYEKVHRPS